MRQTAANDAVRMPRQEPNDLRRLVEAIVASKGQDQLAVDILVNLAAYPGEEGREAQEVLRDLHDRPGSRAAEVDEQIRASLQRSAWTVCELALLTAPEIAGAPFEFPLSVSVALMASQCPVPEGGRDLGAAVKAHVERQLRNADCGMSTTAQPAGRATTPTEVRGRTVSTVRASRRG